uniref:Uncharacterized protein n=1 Tax=Siphoviridae sp. ctEJG5 TaxID=2827814 RepID=A0A8S5RXA3_9CAUD|nr:MAG TPA: hypothetical protein [Siphoviridae sp. ctEJG5]
MDQYMQDKQNGNPEIKVIFGPFHFFTIFRAFSVSEYYKYLRTVGNIVRFTIGMTNSVKACGSPANRCRGFSVGR